MTFVTLSLAILGPLLVGVPIVLHLVMRQQPRRLEFPAVRFIRQRREENRRRLQLRHWLLLALRCAAIAIPALALARPSVASASVVDWLIVALLGGALALVIVLALVANAWDVGRWVVLSLTGLAILLSLGAAGFLWAALNETSESILGHEETPVAAALVIDTSPRMQYRHQNKTRLDEAREMALWLLEQAPRDSQITLLDSQSSHAAAALDVAAAKACLRRLAFAPNVPSLGTALEEAIAAVRQSTLARREIYVLTDFSRAAWNFDATALAARFAEADAQKIQLYVIDVGVENPVNVSLGDITLTSQTLPKNGVLEVTAEVKAQGTGGGRRVRLLLEQPDPLRPTIHNGSPLLPEAASRAEEAVTLISGDTQRVQMQARGLDVGTHHGYVEIVGDDGLPIDDRRYFTVRVAPPWPVLVVGERETASSLIVEALAPYEFRETGKARFECTTITAAQIPSKPLSAYSAVWLLDPAPLPEESWNTLTDYVKSGGGLAIALGPNAQPMAAFNEAAPQQLLPQPLLLVAKAPGELFLSPRGLDHPVVARFRALATAVPWQEFPVRRYWAFKPPVSGAVLNYNNGKPAIVEKLVGRGKSLTLTTPFSEPANPQGREAWNMLATGFEPWPYVMLVNETTLYLAGTNEEKLNYAVGESASLTNRAGLVPSRYQLFTPSGSYQEVAADTQRVEVRGVDSPGAYRLKGSLDGKIHLRGFSVNLPAEATDLERCDRKRLAEIFGDKEFQYARGRDEIRRDIGETRGGREFFPFLLLAVALVWALENLLANRFYRHGNAPKENKNAAKLVREPGNQEAAEKPVAAPLQA